jgi:hypothetical protein
MITITAMTAIAARTNMTTDAVPTPAKPETKKNPPAADARAGYVR